MVLGLLKLDVLFGCCGGAVFVRLFVSVLVGLLCWLLVLLVGDCCLCLLFV